MTLVLMELDSDIDQTVTPPRNVIVEAIRPHLYRHNFPTGNLKLQILTIADVLVAESEEIAIEDIGEMDFFHGYVRFYINAYLKKDTQYKIRLTSTDGYVFDESAYCGWVNGYDLGKYQLDVIPNSVYQYPFDLEIWERTE